MSSTKECGVMPNYAISYSRDGSLGELVGGGYSTYKMDFLYDTTTRALSSPTGRSPTTASSASAWRT